MRSRAYKPVPGIPVLRYVPRLPTLTEAPRGPNDQLEPEPLTFQRTPGANLMDFLNRSAITFLPNFCALLYSGFMLEKLSRATANLQASG